MTIRTKTIDQDFWVKLAAKTDQVAEPMEDPALTDTEARMLDMARTIQRLDFEEMEEAVANGEDYIPQLDSIANFAIDPDNEHWSALAFNRHGDRTLYNGDTRDELTGFLDDAFRGRGRLDIT